MIEFGEKKVIDLLNELHAKTANESDREYLGMSSIGSNDERRIWFEIRMSLPYGRASRIQRRFDVGNAMESLARDWFSKVVHLEGEQLEFTELNGLIKGHCDGIMVKGVPAAPNKPHAWEHKIANAERWNALNKLVVKYPNDHFKAYQEWDETYAGQIICYCHCLETDRAIVHVYNTNTSEYIELRIRLDKPKTRYKKLIQKAERILMMEEPPVSAYSPNDYRITKFHDQHWQDIYVGYRAPLPNCRNCMHCKPEPDKGAWCCTLEDGLGEPIPFRIQKIGCEYHRFLPCLVPADFVANHEGEVLEDDCTVYSIDGVKFFNTTNHKENNTSYGFTSAEISQLSKQDDLAEAIKDPIISGLKKEMNARIERVTVTDEDWEDDIPF